MSQQHRIIAIIALIVALGGLLMGFDASVISGVVKFIEPEFGLSKLELGWAVASLTLTSTLAMLLAGPLSDRIGRRSVLRLAAIIYLLSALGSALAPNFAILVIARMIGGFGVGASLILAPMYIAEISPAGLRGRMVSFNQLNIVVGISAAFFSNYLILQMGDWDTAWVQNLGIKEHNWRWMLGLEVLPALLYFLGLFFVPRSPRWLVMKGHYDEALQVMRRYRAEETARAEIKDIRQSLEEKKDQKVKVTQLTVLFSPGLRQVLIIGVVVAILQQITGINSVFFYAPMIFEQSGIGTDASFVQAILVGLTNLVFTVLAILFIDKLGRKPLLIFGVAGIAISMFVLSYGFSTARYTLTEDSVSELSSEVDHQALAPLTGKTFSTDVSYRLAVEKALGEKAATTHKSALIAAAIDMNPALILIAILSFVASFAISIGPVMWVLFSELFPNAIRGLAISAVGLINSTVSFLVQWVFPWELDHFGSALTFLLYGLFALAGFLFIFRYVPETKGRSLEELEADLTS